MMSLKSFISDLAGVKAPGPNTTFTVFHIFYALELMSGRTIGRNKLAEKLNVGEGAIRTIITRLVTAGLIDTSQEVWGTYYPSLLEGVPFTFFYKTRDYVPPIPAPIILELNQNSILLNPYYEFFHRPFWLFFDICNENIRMRKDSCAY